MTGAIGAAGWSAARATPHAAIASRAMPSSWPTTRQTSDAASGGSTGRPNRMSRQEIAARDSAVEDRADHQEHGRGAGGGDPGERCWQQADPARERRGGADRAADGAGARVAGVAGGCAGSGGDARGRQGRWVRSAARAASRSRMRSSSPDRKSVV